LARWIAWRWVEISSTRAVLSESAEALATWSCTDRKFQMATTAITTPTATKAMKPA